MSSRQHQVQRIGYSPELYTAIEGAGLARGGRILDVGCAGALASEPLVATGYAVTGIDPDEAMLAEARERVPGAIFVAAAAESPPFRADDFDGAISGDAFHRFDRVRAIEQLMRVVRPGGVIAIWWKTIAGGSPLRALRDAVASELGETTLEDPVGGGFRAFYAAALQGQTVRVLPWTYATDVV